MKSIAGQLNMKTRDLLRLNPDVGRRPKPNTTIIIPNKKFKETKSTALTTEKSDETEEDKEAPTLETLMRAFVVHKVKKEETFYSLTRFYNVTEDEIKELSGCGTLTEAAQWIQGKVKVACLTLAERGSIIVTEDEIIGVGAKAVSQVIDSTGAGDLYASGFLFGYARGLDLKICGELASIAAAEIITHTGARPLVPLKSLIESEFRN